MAWLSAARVCAAAAAGANATSATHTATWSNVEDPGRQNNGIRSLGQPPGAEDVLKKDLEAISGVAPVELYGGLQRETQVQVDQHKLEAHGLSILQVTQALSVDNLNMPAGNVTQPDKDWTIRLNTQAQSVGDLQNILVASGPNGSVRIRDVATVVD